MYVDSSGNFPAFFMSSQVRLFFRLSYLVGIRHARFLVRPPCLPVRRTQDNPGRTPQGVPLRFQSDLGVMNSNDDWLYPITNFLNILTSWRKCSLLYNLFTDLRLFTSNARTSGRCCVPLSNPTRTRKCFFRFEIRQRAVGVNRIFNLNVRFAHVGQSQKSCIAI